MRLFLLTFLSALYIVRAQDLTSYIGSISLECAAAFLKLNSDPNFESCVPISSIAPLLVSGVSLNQQTLNNLQYTLNQICTKPKCSSSVIQNAVAEVQSGCSTDIQNGVELPTLIFYGLEWYSPIYDAGCLKNSTGGYCTVETFSNAITSNVTSLYNTTAIAANNLDADISALPSSFVCTVCNKNMLNIVANYAEQNPQDLPPTANASYVSSELQTANKDLTAKCGVNFLDGQTNATSLTPPTVKDVTGGNGNSTNTSSMASSSKMTGMYIAITALAGIIAGWIVI